MRAYSLLLLYLPYLEAGFFICSLTLVHAMFIKDQLI